MPLLPPVDVPPVDAPPVDAPPVDVPQPLLTFTEAIELSNPETERLPIAFFLTIEEGKEEDEFDAFADRARDRGGVVVEMVGGHNPHWYQPDVFVDVLLGAIDE